MTEVLTLDVSEAGVATVRLNRPDASNALNAALKDALVTTLSRVATDDGVRAVVLAATGRSFCVGQDLGELDAQLRTDPSRAGDTVALHFNPITRLLATMPKPVVAAVQGTCVGAGLGFALACDLQVWGAGATLSTAFTKVGLTTDSGLSASLVRAVGVPRAARLLYLSDTFTTEQAVSWGFAGEVLPAEQVEARAQELAALLAQGPTAAYAATKRLLATSPDRPIEEVLEAERVEQLALGTTRDHAAAVAAFLARETPAFTGA